MDSPSLPPSLLPALVPALPPALVKKIDAEEGSGAILVFLPGWEDITKVHETLQRLPQVGTEGRRQGGRIGGREKITSIFFKNRRRVLPAVRLRPFLSLPFSTRPKCGPLVYAQLTYLDLLPALFTPSPFPPL
jgi:hypothetical protein